MKKAAILLLALTAATDGRAQLPDFSGTWVRADSATERPSVASVGDAAFQRGTMGDGWGSPLTLRQSADTLVVEYPHFARYDLQPPLRFAYALNGSESRNAIMIGHAETRLSSRAAWRDATAEACERTLVSIDMTTPPGPRGPFVTGSPAGRGAPQLRPPMSG